MRGFNNLIPPRFPPGPVQGAELDKAFSVLYRGSLAQADVRNPNNDFSTGIVADGEGGITLGSGSKPTGRLVGLPSLTEKLSDAGRASDQSFLAPLMVGNRNSVQSSSSILTSSSTATTSTITIAAHSVQYDFGSVAYSGGTISGLSVGTQYLVYASDPDFQGGAVTYLATTDPTVLAQDSGNYYVGGITTAIAATVGSIQSATTANPAVFTTTSPHGWASGNQVVFAGLAGTFGTNLNGNTYTITVTGASTFSIPVDSTTYTGSFPAGTATRISTSTQGGGGASAGGTISGTAGRWGGFGFA